MLFCLFAIVCRRRDAGLRFAGVVFSGIPVLVFAYFVILCRRRDARRPASCRIASRGSSSLYSEFCVDIGTTGVATLRVGLPMSCMTSRGFSSLDTESCVCVATFSVLQKHKLRFSVAPARSTNYCSFRCVLHPVIHFPKQQVWS
jgi:hypothetical protein